MARAVPTSIISHWSQRIEGMRQSSADFYAEVERVLVAERIDGIKTERVNIAEGGIFSAKREYLQVRRGEHVYHICAAPFGTGFFLSSWLGHVESGFWAWLSEWPVIGPIAHYFFKPITYFKIDTGLMFQSATHAAVLQVLDSLISVKGLRALTDDERKPMMKDFFSRA